MFWYLSPTTSIGDNRLPQRTTLRRASFRWDYRKYLRHYDSQQLNRKLWVHLYHWGLNDVEILMFLNNRSLIISTLSGMPYHKYSFVLLHVCRLNHNALTEL